jgi:hypothetical protein
MMRVLLALAAAVACLGAACGDDDDGAADLTYETYGPEAIAYINGFEDGVFKYPRLEIWEQPECNYDRVLGNAVHGTKVRLIRKKTGCNFTEYEVEFLEGDQTGQVGWIRERFLHLRDEPPPTAPPTSTPAASSAGEESATPGSE